MFEYACHEGNYGMADIPSGARAEEKKAAERKESEVMSGARRCASAIARSINNVSPAGRNQNKKENPCKKAANDPDNNESAYGHSAALGPSRLLCGVRQQ
jgi:hypothetical protein